MKGKKNSPKKKREKELTMDMILKAAVTVPPPQPKTGERK